MMKEIDLTGHKFDFVDYSEGNIFFETFMEGEDLEIKIWGATLMHELGIEKEDVYVADISNLVFEDVKYIFINYGIYANEQGTRFISNMVGDNVDMKLSLGKKDNLSDYKEYMIGGILGRNIGYGEMTVYCKGKVMLTYNEEALIGASEFCLHTEKYRFK